MDQLLGYIKTLQMEGSVLVFLPGWNTISGLMKHFKACFQIRFSDWSKKSNRKVECILPIRAELPSGTRPTLKLRVS